MSSKSVYYVEMLEAHKHKIKETWWAILRQAIHKQKEFSKFPQAFIINGHEVTNMKQIAEEFNNCFVRIGKTIYNLIGLPVKQFEAHLSTKKPQLNLLMCHVTTT